ncbi:MAG TPA: inorganic phosphate transporter [Phycisphaerae bacterium]
MIILLAVLLVALLAFANGANDNSKGVATLVGYGAASPRAALIFAGLTTAIGAGLSFWLAGGLIAAFKTKLFATGTPLDTGFYVAVLIGAVGWIVFATYSGLPVSTTHAIVGGLIGAGLVAFGSHQILWSFLAYSVAVPLVLGPVISTVLVYALAWPVVAVSRRMANRCLCVIETATVVPGSGTIASLPLLPEMQIATGTLAECAAQGAAAAATTSATATAIHWTSGGLVGFARGWNDAPKIAALSIVALTAANIPNPAGIGFLIVTLAMALGGLFAGRRVLETLAKKLTPLPLAESLTASLTTAALVSAASWMGMPVSTTHVSTGAIIGAGLKNNPAAVKWAKVIEIGLSWVITLPVAALIAAAAMWAGHAWFHP